MLDLEVQELADGGMQQQQQQLQRWAGDGLLHGPLGDELVADDIAGGSTPLELGGGALWGGSPPLELGGGEQQGAFDNDAFVDTVVQLCRD